MIPSLPFEVWDIIFQINKQDESVVTIQRMWKGYRIRRLLIRFTVLRFLQTFREWNPSARVYLTRTISVFP